MDEDAADTTTWYLDGDGDDHGLDSDTVASCERPEGYGSLPGDCDDGDASIYDGAPEIVNDGIDQDCDGGDTCYADADDDGYRPDAGATVSSADLDCLDPGEARADDPIGDCDDGVPSVYVGAPEGVADGVDQDCDGGDTCYLDADDDGQRPDATSIVRSLDLDCADPGEAELTDPTTDCDDSDASIYDGASELVADGVDQDCDGGDTCYLDADDDGYRPDAISVIASADLDCTDSGEALASDPVSDCDDGDRSIYGGAAELVADGIDQDCDGGDTCYADADDDGYRPDASATVSSPDLDCFDPGEARALDPIGDCDDSDASIYDGAPEVVADGIDQDCDGGEVCYVDADDDGQRPDASSTVSSADLDCSDPGEAEALDPSTDCDDRDASIYDGAPEVVDDGIDQDCDGGDTCYLDADDDGQRPDASATVSSADLDCSDPGEAAGTDPSTDCDDGDAGTYRGAPEITGDGIDQDCDGGEVCYLDADDDGQRPDATATVVSADADCLDPGEASAAAPVADCDDSDASTYDGASEIVADGIDQDCDGGEVCYVDADDDGYRPDATATVASPDLDCLGAGEAEAGDPIDDCDDGDPDINPGAAERYNDATDEDCDGYAPWDISALTAGDLAIGELMIDPVAVADADGEWFEIQNLSGLDLELAGLRLADLDTDSTSISALLLPAGERAVLGRQADGALSGGVGVDYAYSGLELANVEDELLLSVGLLEIDALSWDAKTALPPAGQAWSADDSGTWCGAVAAYGDGDLGSPGEANPDCLSHDLDIQPIWDAECVTCHDTASPSGGLDLELDAWAHIVGVADPETGLAYVAPYDPEGSYLWHKLLGTQADVGGDGAQMPKDAAPLDSVDLDDIETWILQGALE